MVNSFVVIFEVDNIDLIINIIINLSKQFLILDFEIVLKFVSKPIKIK